MKKQKINNLKFEDFITVIPIEILEERIGFLCGKRELKHFRNFMSGQTVGMIEQQGGIFADDFERYLIYRKRNLSGDKMPLDD